MDYKGDIDNVLERTNLSAISVILIKCQYCLLSARQLLEQGVLPENIIIGHYKNGVVAILPLDSNSYTNIYLAQISSEIFFSKNKIN